MIVIISLILCRIIILAFLYRHNNIINIRDKQKHVIQKSLEEVYTDFSDLRGDIKILLQYQENGYVVFIDIEGDLDWETKGEFDDKLNTKEANEILMEIDIIQRQAGFRYLSFVDRESIVWRLGRALVSTLNMHNDLAKEMIEETKIFFVNRKMEITRKWQLLIAIILFISILLTVVFINAYFDYEVRYWAHYMLYSSLGVLLSISYKTGNLRYDCGAGKCLNILQIITKYIVGCIGALFLISLYNNGIVFNSLMKSDTEITLMLLGIISGFSERLAPSLIEEMSLRKDE